MNDLRSLPLADPAELSGLGVIQEVNRLLLHPLGLALSWISENEEQMRTRIRAFLDEFPSDEYNGIEDMAMALLAVFGIEPGNRINGVLDGRTDPEGFRYEGVDLAEGMRSFRSITAQAAPARVEALGYVVQPVNDKA